MTPGTPTRQRITGTGLKRVELTALCKQPRKTAKLESHGADKVVAVGYAIDEFVDANRYTDEQMTEDSEKQVTAASLASRAGELATLPDVYLRTKTIIDDPTSSHEDVADALATDPALAARLLRMANSAFYGRPGRIATIPRAVGLLGTQQVHDLVLATAVVHAFDGFSSELIEPHEFWRASLFSGATAKTLAEQCGILDCERLFVGGLLAPVGLLVMFKELPARMRAIFVDSRDQGWDLAFLQRDRLGFDHAELSAKLFSSWQLPAELVKPIGQHTRPEAAEDFQLEAAIIHIAVQLATAQAQGKSVKEIIPLLNDDAWQITEMSFERLEQGRVDAQALTEEMVPVLLGAAA